MFIYSIALGYASTATTGMEFLKYFNKFLRIFNKCVVLRVGAKKCKIM